MQFIGRGRGVNPLEAAARRRARPADPSLNLLQWAIGIGGTAVLAVLGSALALRMRREALEPEPVDAEPPADDLMETVREAYFDGQIDSAEYHQVRRKLNPAARDEPTPTRPPDLE